jgi:uncharacterized 2Fe-2S/4Fe-4S cluster protein (DUF4445 family)
MNEFVNMCITVTLQPMGRKIEVKKGTTVLAAARLAGVGLSAICGGHLACGSCVIKVPKRNLVNAPTATEVEILGKQKLAQNFRLACQTIILETTVIEIPAESLTALQRTQVEGEEERIVFDPLIRIHDLSVTKTISTSARDDWKSVLLTLENLQISTPKQFSLNSVKDLSRTLRKNEGKIRLVTRGQELISVFSPHTPVLGMAVDIGTTKIAGYLLNMENGETLAQAGRSNPQISFGEDVMTRITHIMKEKDGNLVLQSLIVDAINSLSKELCKNANLQSVETGATKTIEPIQICDFVMVGNTAMHHIFLGLSVHQLGLAPYLPTISEPLDFAAHELFISAAPGTKIHLLPNIAGFIGADHTAMLLAAGIRQEQKSTLYLDIGTNSEITLRTGKHTLACSAASGPAFEGAHIRDGMRAGEGAIERVRITNNQIFYQTIAQSKPVGICGSGIVDAIAQMLTAGIINPQGSFNRQHPLVKKGEKGLQVIIAPAAESQQGQDIVITAKDVSEIQLAKGAIRTGITLLLRATQTTNEQIEKVVLAGAFGSYLSIESANTIGLIPHFRNAQITQIGNAAGIGAKQALLSAAKRAEALEIGEQIKTLELSNHPDFSNEFTKALGFNN